MQFESFAPFAFLQHVFLVSRSSSFLQIAEEHVAENTDQFITLF